MNFIRAAYVGVILIFSQVFGFGAEIGVNSFLIPSILMGLGVAIDVFIATIVQYNDDNLSWKNWTLPVTLTHTLFPAIGYFLFWSASENFPVTKVILGIFGFILVFLFIYEVICESIDKEPVFGISAWIGDKFNFSESRAHVLVAILAVSWDALWSGPAKAAQAVAGEWTGPEVILSFLIAGVVVAIMAELALGTTYVLRKIKPARKNGIAWFNVVGKYLELSVIGGFGILSLWHVFSAEANLYQSVTISGIFILLIFIFIGKSLYKSELREANQSLS